MGIWGSECVWLVFAFLLYEWHEAFGRMCIVLVAGFGNGDGRQRANARINVSIVPMKATKETGVL